MLSCVRIRRVTRLPDMSRYGSYVASIYAPANGKLSVYLQLLTLSPMRAPLLWNNTYLSRGKGTAFPATAFCNDRSKAGRSVKLADCLVESLASSPLW